MLYHARLLLPSRCYGRYRSRRGLSLGREFANYLCRIAGVPLRRRRQRRLAGRLFASGRRYHLVLLQLSFDCSMQVHSRFACSAEFAADCIGAFAEGAPSDDLLVFKSHPFEDGRERLDWVIAAAAARAGVAERVLFVDGGVSLATLLDGAATAVTINSTAAQQALWRGLPVAALGRAVYGKPGLVSGQSLAAFFAAPEPPDREAYWRFRQFLLETSQLRGSFYSQRGIAALLTTLPAAILAPADPYARVLENWPERPPVARLASVRPAIPVATAENPELPCPRRAAV
jgi:capsular polysaccharide export protein